MPFVWNHLRTSIPMSLVGGVMAVENHDGFATPALDRALLRGPIGKNAPPLPGRQFGAADPRRAWVYLVGRERAHESDE